MRDLVETVIAQVIKEPYNSPASNREVSAERGPAFVKSYATPGAMNRSEIKDEKLWDVCCKFEAIFMQQMMSAMRKSVPKSGFLPSGYAEGVHDSMMDQAIADSGSKNGNLGIALQMYRQLESSEVAHDEAIQGIQEATDNVDMTIYNDIKGGS
ncbi:MAG: rod-binding protein [Mariprofundaceae bacterium]